MSVAESGRALVLRAGRKVGRTLYLQLGPEPSDADPLVGVMDTRALAASVVAALSDLAAVKEDLKRIAENAESWHGPEVDTGHAKALRVIAANARAARCRLGPL